MPWKLIPTPTIWVLQRCAISNAAGADQGGEIGELHDPESHLIPLALAAASGRGSELQVFGTDYPNPDGNCIRDYVHVNDLAEAHVLALKELNAGTRS